MLADLRLYRSLLFLPASNPRAIEKWGKVPVLCVVPDVPGEVSERLHADVVAAMKTVDWGRFAGMSGLVR